MADDRDPAWFLAQLKPNSANIADRNLQRQGFKTFLPMEEVTRRQQGKFKNVLQPLFPGYIFVSLDVLQGSWGRINSTYGVTRVVSFGNAPAEVPRELVLQLMLRCDAMGKMLPPSSLKPGDKVRLTTGPFANYVAEIERIAPDRRVWVLMDLMGGQTRVVVQPDALSIE